jgi:hypothetical protein
MKNYSCFDAASGNTLPVVVESDTDSDEDDALAGMVVRGDL